MGTAAAPNPSQGTPVPGGGFVLPTIRLQTLSEFAVPPIVVPSVHDHAANAGAVSADPFGSGLYHNMRTMLQRAKQVTTCAEGIINNQRQIMLFGKCSNFVKIGNVEARVTYSF